MMIWETTLGNPKPGGWVLEFGFASPWSFERPFDGQDNYTKMLQEKDLLLESQDLLWKYSPENLTNSSPENQGGWFRCIPYKKTVPFFGTFVSFRGCMWVS